MNLSKIPRTTLAHLPTPLEFMGNLSRTLSGPRLFVKRDDCTGLALGGNKTRKLEFSMGAALHAGADLIITSGGTQSNHVRQTAAAAARLQIECHCVIANPLKDSKPDYLTNGNVLLDDILGAKIHIASDTDAATTKQVNALVERAREAGRNPWVIPVGASDAIGSVGYVACAQEMLAQFEAAGMRPSHIVLGTGSAGTHAGLLTGLRLFGSDIRVVGIAVSETSEIKQRKVGVLVDALLAHLGANPVTGTGFGIQVRDEYVGGGYAIPSAATLAAVRLAAEQEALILDPVYTGKAMAGMIDLIAGKKLGEARDVVFLHTGGSPAMFAYTESFSKTAAVLPTIRDSATRPTRFADSGHGPDLS